MVHYIRFLKPPKLDARKCFVRALITITTDLGDDFYPGDLTLYAAAVCEAPRNSAIEWQTIQWKRGSRNIWIEIKRLNFDSTKSMQLLINAEHTAAADLFLFENLPEIVSARSLPFEWQISQAGNKIERRYKTQVGNERVIYEETGESIARHLW